MPSIYRGRKFFGAWLAFKFGGKIEIYFLIKKATPVYLIKFLSYGAILNFRHKEYICELITTLMTKILRPFSNTHSLLLLTPLVYLYTNWLCKTMPLYIHKSPLWGAGFSSGCFETGFKYLVLSGISLNRLWSNRVCCKLSYPIKCKYAHLAHITHSNKKKDRKKKNWFSSFSYTKKATSKITCRRPAQSLECNAILNYIRGSLEYVIEPFNY